MNDIEIDPVTVNKPSEKLEMQIEWHLQPALDRASKSGDLVTLSHINIAIVNVRMVIGELKAKEL